ncbi:MAG: SDR family NAD(P)-dependent oxidoreductase [Anaerolineaceae bacterium]|nr:SDR family NAD(P)-dependent oxidoreductase [Anaerolineaceae bacterium]
MKQADWKDSIAVVTGASGGIGAAITRRLAGRGLCVIAVSRSLERLKALAAEDHPGGGVVIPFLLDLNNPDSAEHLYEEVARLYAPIRVLVNNAGLGWYGYFDEMPWEVAGEIIRVNMVTTVHLTNLFLPGMKARQLGRIINIGSVVGSIPSQGVVMYAASKAFMDAFTTALHRELVRTGVRVGVVRAGPVRTEFYSRAAGRANGRRLPTERMGISADQVARVACSLLDRPRQVVYAPAYLAVTPWVEACFGWLMNRLGPLLLERKATRF